MNTQKGQSYWLIASLMLMLAGCATSPQPVTGICPPFPKLPQELQASPPTLYLLPLEMRER